MLAGPSNVVVVAEVRVNATALHVLPAHPLLLPLHVVHQGH